MSGPLKGITVLSFGRVLSGPYAAMLMADLGAEVIKIEDPKHGDLSRNNGPYIGDTSSYYLSINRGKKSFSLDLRSKESKPILKELISKVDILLENFRPGIMKKIGFDYDTVKTINPKLIYVSISGFGQFGPYSQRPAYDLIAQGMGGTVSITGEPGRPPARVGYSIGDLGSALYATVATMAALYEREKSGIGQLIDVAMLDSQVALCENAIARYLSTGEVPEASGSKHPLVVPFQVFPTKTDDMIVVNFKNEDWSNLCKAIGKLEWITDARFETMAKRIDTYDVLEPMLINVFIQKTRNEWLEIFDEVGVIASAVNNIEQVVSDPHINSREMIIDVMHERLGNLKTVGTPMKFSRTSCDINKAAPDLGEHTNYILKDILGLSADAIIDLKRDDVI